MQSARRSALSNRETQRAAKAALVGARRGSERDLPILGSGESKGPRPSEKQDLVQVKRPHNRRMIVLRRQRLILQQFVRVLVQNRPRSSLVLGI